MQRTIRFFDWLDVLVQRGACEAGYREFNDYVVELVGNVLSDETVPQSVTDCWARLTVAQSDGKPGRPSLGDRKQHTIRFPVPIHTKIERAAAQAGYQRSNEYVIDLVAAALKASVTPPPLQDDALLGAGGTLPAFVHDSLPLGA